MTRVKLYIYIIIVILSFLFLIPPTFPQEEDLKEIKELRDDVQIINLLNNLDLRQNQMEFILQKAKEAKSIRDSVQAKVNSCKSEMTAAMSAIKDEVGEGKVMVDKENAETFHSLKGEIEQLTRVAYDDIGKLAKSVESNLEEFQLLALDSYKPCIIPIIQNGRIGQAEGSKGVIKALERVKDIPPVKYEEIKDTLAQRIIEKTKSRLPPNIKLDEQQAKVKIFNMFEKVRSMEEIEFTLQKEVLAEELESRILPEKPRMERTQKIREFLLRDNIIPILEKKISQGEQTTIKE